MDTISQGWLTCDMNNKKVQISQFTKVRLIEQKSDYEMVEILEGRYENKIISLPYIASNKKNKVTYLSEFEIINSPVVAFYSESKKKLLIKGLGEFSAYIKNPFTKGDEIKICLPDYPHLERYSSKFFNEKTGGSRFVGTWFKLLSNNSKIRDSYLHYGSISEGCLTVIYKKNDAIWNKIYLYLLKHRLDNYSVGILSITE